MFALFLNSTHLNSACFQILILLFCNQKTTDTQNVFVFILIFQNNPKTKTCTHFDLHSYLQLFFKKYYRIKKRKRERERERKYMKLTRVVWQEMVKILNVAEKNDAAKSIAGLLSRGSSRMV